MREIKFRIWDKKNAKFISKWERVFINAWECCVYTKSELEKSNFSYCNDLSEIEVNQFTGLKDKYGKEIYEGDIVERSTFDLKKGDYTRKSEVHFLEGAFCIYTEDWFSQPLSDDIAKECEIIGNIYENKDLLK